jgi:cell shape-determining protein MreD
MRRAPLLLLVVLCALTPLLAPVPWARSGLLPDVAVVAVVYAAFAAGPSPAALLGVAVGAAACPWTAEPLGQGPLLLGLLGWAVGHAGRSLERDRLPVRAAAVLAGVLLVRGAEAAAALAGSGGGLGAADAGALLAPVLMCAAATTVLAPAGFALLRRSRLLATIEAGSRTGV